MTKGTRLDISILVPGMPFQGDTLEHKSLGGSETAGLCMARELAKLGNRVTVFSNTEAPGKYDGVEYRSAQEWQLYASTCPHDVAIAQRSPAAFQTRTAAKLNLLWCHDLALKRSYGEFRGVLWNVDKIMVLSDFMRRQYSEVYDLPESVLWQTRNGIDLDRFPEPKTERNRKQLVFASRPERGMDNLLRHILPKLLQRDPKISLVMCGYDNQVDHLSAFYGELEQLAADFGDRVRWAGNLTKAELYDLYASSGVYVYPTPSPTAKTFAEISCITAMECMASGLPIVCSDRGALPETVAPGCGITIGGDPWNEDYQEAFVDNVLGLIRNEAAWNQMSNEGRRHAEKALGWDRVAEEWSEEMERLIVERNDDPIRLARHFVRNSDIVAAKKTLKGIKGKAATELRKDINRHYGFMKSAQAHADHYRAMGEDTSGWLQTREFPKGHFEHTEEQRFDLIERILRERPHIRTVLDYGCGHGWGILYWQSKFPGRKWTGLDVDPGAVEWARHYAEREGRNLDELAFVAGDHTTDLSEHGPFDALIVTEVLEHVLDPKATMEALERWVKPGGLVIVTTPYGPVEYGSYNWEKFRNHIHHFEGHDLRDLFGGKPRAKISTVPEGMHDLLSLPVGFHLIVYEADQEPLGDIDYKRKVRLQRPRETLSASLIAGPGAEETLRWCLESVRHLADEIVIADTGMSEAGKQAAQEFGAVLVKGSNPLEHGFETPRNQSLQACTSDWVLWIDTDERMTTPEHLHKYLRHNLFSGYSIRQHHFSIDADFKPDMPVRVFRRHIPGEENQIRFFGMIHEHPEKALNEGPGTVVVIGDVNIAHVGYLVEKGRRRRFSRNHPLLMKDVEKYPERVLQKFFICRDNMLLVQYEIEQNGGRITPSIEARCREVIGLYREHFQGKTTYMGIDALTYYSQAARLLGEGFEATIALGVRRENVGDSHVEPQAYWFADAADFKAEIDKSVREKLDPITAEYF